MSEITVTDTTIPSLLTKLRSGEWLTPEFQRDFVWNSPAVIGLINSIIDAKPVGMITLWEQENESDLVLEHISIPDWEVSQNRTAPSYFGDDSVRPGRFYAILDGKQRSTAIALAFGGHRAQNGSYKHSGRYFLNVSADDPLDRIEYIKEADVRRRGLDVLSTCVGTGVFPLAAEDPSKIFQQWMGYTAMIGQEQHYPNGVLPSPEELAKRKALLEAAFDGIIKTKLAIYVVPKEEDLASICEIFETLNTTGTKVSTVDLIHSWLYADTKTRLEAPILLRQEIDDLGQYDGAVGWASSTERPELIAQFAAAIHVALDNKPEPRSVSGAKVTKITSVKSPDLLAVPDSLWELFFDRKEAFAKFLGEMQDAVAGGKFTQSQCPYPASATIYAALRWYQEFDAPSSINWQKQHLDNLFRAFFWRNALTNRYDQGFLTKIGRDIIEIKEFLTRTPREQPMEDWKVDAQNWLEAHLPIGGAEERISQAVRDGSVKGALRKAVLLPLLTRSLHDVVNPDLNIRNVHSALELHHIYPRAWCANNKSGAAKEYLDPNQTDKDWVSSPANLMPMARKSNLEWRAKIPAMVIDELDITSTQQLELFSRYFVDSECLESLRMGAEGFGPFLERRASQITNHLMRLMSV
ncbi:MAG: hypothetical protein VR75_18160 [Hyphomonadaceae bacterium BRH_c29]|nr:MAG: hypothetical protein VR75_18160 [Hyphomonadaceae bacterium BRH_c29]